jgi:hypothetical protein
MAGTGARHRVTEDRARVECYISMGKESDQRNKAAFRALHDRKSEIEQAFGGPLDWQELPNRIGCRICADLPGGWKTPEQDWADLQDRMLNAMVRLEAALKAPVQALRV